MADLKPETIEPDPAATSLENDQTVNGNGTDASAPTTAEDAKPSETVAPDVAEDVKDSKPAAESQQPRRNENKNKFDPSTLPETDDHSEIRKQV